MAAREAVTWIAVGCAGFALTYFVGSVVLRVMWEHSNS
jgi:hypothetical protein